MNCNNLENGHVMNDSIWENAGTFRPVCPFVFLLGLSEKADEWESCALRRVFHTFLDKARYCDPKVEFIILQYAQEDIKTLLHAEADKVEEAAIVLERWGTPASPFKALEKAIVWIKERKEAYQSAGQAYHKFQVICFPNLHNEQVDDKTAEDFMWKCLDCRRYVMISAYQMIYQSGQLNFQDLTQKSYTTFGLSDLFPAMVEDGGRLSLRNAHRMLYLLDNLLCLNKIPKVDWTHSFEV